MASRKVPSNRPATRKLVASPGSTIPAPNSVGLAEPPSAVQSGPMGFLKEDDLSEQVTEELAKVGPWPV